MDHVDTSGRVPIKLWLDDIEDGAMEQARNAANHPFAFRHVAVMPDAHQGYGVPIGCVFATQGAVIPNAVGVDIGCGMIAQEFILPSDTLTPDGVKETLDLVRRMVPVGIGPKGCRDGDKFLAYPTVGGPLPWENLPPIVEKHHAKAVTQIGTLGGGNHFIELQAGSDGHLWAMIHSGSRALGMAVAKHYNNLAKELNEMWCSSVTSKNGLAFLPLGGGEADSYIREMEYCLRYAAINRREMMNAVGDALNEVVGAAVGRVVHNSHNYARMEHHFKQNVMIHRKGATSAKEGELGIIPGSQGSKSYIVKGKGERESFQSCSHGAGRLMSRRKAKDNLDMDATIADLESRGIVHSIRGAGNMDEAPGAYKNIEAVMTRQMDLVDIEVQLTPLGVVKG